MNTASYYYWDRWQVRNEGSHTSLVFVQLQVHYLLLYSLFTRVEVPLLYSKCTFSAVKENMTFINQLEITCLGEITSIWNPFVQCFHPVLNLSDFPLKPDDSEWVTPAIRKGYELNWKSAPTAADIMAWRFLSSRLPKQQPLALSTARKTWIMLSLSCTHN